MALFLCVIAMECTYNVDQLGTCEAVLNSICMISFCMYQHYVVLMQ